MQDVHSFELQGYKWKVALSVTEAEYVALSQALREVIPIMNLMKEMNDYGYNVGNPVPKIHCKAFEDNNGALIMAQEHKSRPRTKHIAVKYHHFRQYVDSGEISIHPITTDLQVADIFTKPLNEVKFIRHRKCLVGW